MPLINFDLGMNMEASGYENILLSGLVLGLPHDEIERNMETIIAFSGLGDAIHQRCELILQVCACDWHFPYQRR